MVWSSSPAHWRNELQEVGSGERPDQGQNLILYIWHKKNDRRWGEGPARKNNEQMIL